MKIPLIIFNGESNSGGFAQNSSAMPSEIAANPAVKLLNPVTLQFENMDIGTNNLLDHAGLDLSTHGWELELGNYAKAGKFGVRPIYLCKTGQGGSVIEEWVGADQTYWNKFLDRINAAKTALAGKNYIPIVWFTQGINDALAGTPPDRWRPKVIQHFAKIRAELPGVQILYCQPPVDSTGYTAWLPAIDEIVAGDPNIYLISSLGATKRDIQHWDYDGMKVISRRLCEKTISLHFQQRKLFSPTIPPWKRLISRFYGRY